ncbi:hypothetical protein NDU88_004714 [Pleurodeles waltl]|uniref:Uncharacterized protein n=1 Tax=Pleurodeles waltl TaxID=8319 RepID=A0AAV7W9D2_PLEWA|nr:hypothetical protein NDU88_004714 [Pleurodeles waltl]
MLSTRPGGCGAGTEQLCLVNQGEWHVECAPVSPSAAAIGSAAHQERCMWRGQQAKSVHLKPQARQCSRNEERLCMTLQRDY